MSNFCLLQNQIDKLINSLPEDVNVLIDMSSEDRLKFFSDIAGKEMGKKISSLIESKLLLKNQQLGLKNAIESLVKGKADVKRDLLSKVERLDTVMNKSDVRDFLSNIVEQRLGMSVTREETTNLIERAKLIKSLKEKIPESAPEKDISRLEYGLALNDFKEYASKLKSKSDINFKEGLKTPSEYVSYIKKIAGALKSSTSSLDNSFFGRQGLSTLLTNPDIWFRRFFNSFDDMIKEFKGVDTQALTKADVWSRKNAINGKYEKMEIALGMGKEEAYPSSLPTKIPFIGKFFKASEAAYNNAALRLRADLADRYIKYAEEGGINILNKAEAKPIGQVVNSLTGRGSLGKFEAIGDTLNVMFFSPRLLTGSLDVLTAHLLRKNMTPFARKLAAKNLVKIAGSTAAVLTLANTIYPGSVVLDPRSSDFGMIKIGKRKYDITGGKKGLLTVAARLVPTTHNGKLSFWYKNSKGKYYDLTDGSYGQINAVDVFNDFWMGKLSPTTSLLRNLWTGKTYSGDKVSLSKPKETLKLISNATLPIPVQNTIDLLNDRSSEDIFWSILADELGISNK